MLFLSAVGLVNSKIADKAPSDDMDSAVSNIAVVPLAIPVTCGPGTIAAVLVIGAESFDDNNRIDFKEVVLLKQNPWNGQKIRDLDISRQTLIVMVKRNGKAMIPNGNFVLMEGDRVIMYTQVHYSNSHLIQI